MASMSAPGDFVCGDASSPVQRILRALKVLIVVVFAFAFDLVAGFNALSPDAMRQVERYVTVHKPRIMLLSTPCTGMKGFASLNAEINPEAHARSLSISVPLAKLSFCN